MNDKWLQTVMRCDVMWCMVWSMTHTPDETIAQKFVIHQIASKGRSFDTHFIIVTRGYVCCLMIICWLTGIEVNVDFQHTRNKKIKDCAQLKMQIRFFLHARVRIDTIYAKQFTWHASSTHTRGSRNKANQGNRRKIFLFSSWLAQMGWKKRDIPLNRIDVCNTNTFHTSRVWRKITPHTHTRNIRTQIWMSILRSMRIEDFPESHR